MSIVKPLEWRDRKTLGEGSREAVAESVFGQCIVIFGGFKNGKCCVQLPWRVKFLWLDVDLEGGQRHAETLYEARILSAIDPTAIAAEARRKAMEEVIDLMYETSGIFMTRSMLRRQILALINTTPVKKQ